MTDVNATATTRSGVGFGGLLLIILIVLKLNPGGYLDSPVQDWSWWLVIFAPFLLSLVSLLLVAVVIAVIFGVGALVLSIADKRQKRKRDKFLAARHRERAGSDRFSR